MPPFVNDDCRRYIGDDHASIARTKTAGDKCFVYYRGLIRAWKKSARWTTADQLLASLVPDAYTRAKVLAYAVFFVLHVIPYEIKKRKENGEVE